MKKLVFLFMIYCLLVFPCAYSSDTHVVLAKIRNIEKTTHCQLGLSAIHVETNEKISYQGEQPFLMASTVKLPIAVALLARVDTGKECLNRKVKLRKQDAVPGSGQLFTDLNQNPEGRLVSMRQLLTLMLVVSDNTASDRLLKEVNGPKAVATYLKQKGFNRIQIKRSIFDLYWASSGLPLGSKQLMHDAKRLQLAEMRVNLNKKLNAWKQFEVDSRDRTTPNDMTRLLAEIYDTQLLKPRSKNLLLTIMRHCRTGEHRIKGMLPPCASVAHKTGTWTICKDRLILYPPARHLNRFAGDCGIISLPHHKGHVALAVYVQSTALNDSEREKAIALAAKSVYEYFMH